jgi:hypothetical protein
MFVVRATKKLLSRLGPATLGAGEESATLLGDWHATALPWRPQVALFVNDRTLLPVLTPLAPARTLLRRFPDTLADVLATHRVPGAVSAAELDPMREHRLGPTANRSVVGSMTEFAFLAETYRRSAAAPDLLALSMRLATVPCGPLYRSHISPDRELTALLGSDSEV